MPGERGALIRGPFGKKKSCSTLGFKASDYAAAEFISCTNQACRTEACEKRLMALFTGHSGEIRPGPSLDQRLWHVYSPIIRTGHSPPSQLSTLRPVVAGKGFLCLLCKDGGNLVER